MHTIGSFSMIKHIVAHFFQIFVKKIEETYKIINYIAMNRVLITEFYLNISCLTFLVKISRCGRNQITDNLSQIM